MSEIDFEHVTKIFPNGSRGVDWQMKIDEARCKLKSVYPKIKI